MDKETRYIFDFALTFCAMLYSAQAMIYGSFHWSVGFLVLWCLAGSERSILKRLKRMCNQRSGDN